MAYIMEKTKSNQLKTVLSQKSFKKMFHPNFTLFHIQFDPNFTFIQKMHQLFALIIFNHIKLYWAKTC